MAGIIKHINAVKRYGTRYGRRNREKAGKIEAEQRKSHKCPYCNFAKVKRLAVGIWQCGKCKIKFTSRAYTVSKPPAIRNQS